jgi:hypothetical protein
MSNALPGSSTAPSAGRHLSLPAWMREPLLHFIVLGVMLFTIDHLIAGRGDNPHTITVDASVDQRARELFKQEHGRDPNAEELRALRRPWLEDEVLYREGIAMQLDKGDPAIRDRVIFKVRGMIEAGLGTPTFDEKTLRAWFEKNRAKYDRPAAPADLEKFGGIVLQDWIDATMAEQRSAAILAMEKRYTVEVTGGDSTGGAAPRAAARASE